ncbi:MAG: hypothetical protein AAB531_02430 [Patescibacteria group bacterium]
MKWFIVVVLALAGFGLIQSAQAQSDGCVDSLMQFEIERGAGAITPYQAQQFCDSIASTPTPEPTAVQSSPTVSAVENDQQTSDTGVTIVIIIGTIAAVVIIGGGTILIGRRRPY